MRGSRKKPFAIEDEITTNAEPARVMETILDASSWPRWQSEIRATSGPTKIEAGDEISGDAQMMGFAVEGLSHAREVTPRGFAEDVVVGVRMQVHYSVADEGGRTVVRRSLHTNLPGGAMGSVLSLLLRWRLKRMQVELLRRLSAQASEGSG